MPGAGRTLGPILGLAPPPGFGRAVVAPPRRHGVLDVTLDPNAGVEQDLAAPLARRDRFAAFLRDGSVGNFRMTLICGLDASNPRRVFGFSE